MVIVDQHAAHERLVYERMKADAARGDAPRQALLIPEVVELDPAEAERVVAHAAELAELGLVVEALRPRRRAGARDARACWARWTPRRLVRDVADDLAELGGAQALEERLLEVFASAACRGIGARRAGG